MSKQFWYLAFTIIIAAGATAGLAQDLDPNLVGWWKFDGDALDSSGNGRDGTLMGDAHFIDGLLGQALSLDGSGDYVNIDGYKGINAIDEVQQPFTVANWFRITATSGDHEMVTWGTSAGRQRLTWRVHEGTLRTEHASGNLRGNTYVNDGEWHHGALVVTEGANLRVPATRLFVDGVEDTTFSGSDNPYNLTEGVDVRIGMSGPQNGRYWPGDLDEVRIYDRALTDEEVAALALWPRSHGPEPVNGALIEAASVELQWVPGDFAAQHAVYLGTNPELGPAEMKALQAEATYTATDLVQEETYYWRIDDVEADGTIRTGDVWSFWVAPQRAYSPQPLDGLVNVLLDGQLNWTAGWSPLMHAVYFGTDADVVAGATGAMPQMDPISEQGPLEKDTTYYWRVDEFYNGVWVTGPVWSFSTVPAVAPIDDPNLVAWYPLEAGAGRTALDMTGNDHHATFVGEPEWTDGLDGGGLTLSGLMDREYFKHSLPEATSWPAFTVAVWVKAALVGQRQYSGVFASHYPNTAGIQIGTNGADPGIYRVNPPGGTTLPFGSVTTEWVHLALTCEDSNAVTYYNGFLGATGTLDATNTTFNQFAFGVNRNDETTIDGIIDDARVYDKSFTEEEIREMFGDVLIAWQPQPMPGTVADVLTITEMSWTPGDGAVEHDVYLGWNELAVATADTASSLYQGRQAETTFAPADGFTPGLIYFWRIDEVDAEGTVSVGNVWSFTITDGIIVSDVQTTIDYNNVAEPYVTEAALDVAQDWVQAGLADLSLEYKGVPAVIAEADGVVTLSGAGNDIWDTSDQFRFAYAELEGDISMVARVASNGNGTNEWAKGGVMIRQSLDGGSMHAFMPITAGGGNGASFQRRIDTDGSSTNSDNTSPVAPPYWVKLDRVGNTFAGSISEDGENWMPLGDPVEIAMTDPVLVGLAVTSHVGGQVRAFQFSDISVNGELVSAADALAVADVGVEQGANDPAPLYVAVEDAAGASAVAVHPDAAATTVDDWTEWRVSLADLAAAGVDLTSVVKVAVGVGDGQPDGTGTVQVRNIQVVKPVANIVWVSDGYDDNGDEISDDLAWADLLTAQGYNVNYVAPSPELGDGYWTELDQDKLDALNAADLVIVSRNSNSGDYANDDEETQWNSVTSPLILMSTHIVRSSRWKFLDTTSTNNAVALMQAADLTSPAFAGVNLDANAQVEALTAELATFPGTAEAGNGTVIATRADTGEIWIAAWDAGVEYYDGAGETAGGPRMFFTGGTQETDEPNVGRGEVNLTAEGQKVFLNSVKMMLP